MLSDTVTTRSPAKYTRSIGSPAFSRHRSRPLPRSYVTSAPVPSISATSPSARTAGPAVSGPPPPPRVRSGLSVRASRTSTDPSARPAQSTLPLFSCTAKVPQPSRIRIGSRPVSASIATDSPEPNATSTFPAPTTSSSGTPSIGALHSRRRSLSRTAVTRPVPSFRTPKYVEYRTPSTRSVCLMPHSPSGPGIRPRARPSASP